MFALTPRLTLRPGWPEDAAELARAIGHEAVVRNLARAPWPYGTTDAEAVLAKAQAPHEPRFLIFDRTGPASRLVGGMTIDLTERDGPDLVYWIAPQAWGFGYATEAGRAVVAIARHALRLGRLQAGHFMDNPASARVLHKLGFRSTGRVVLRHSRGRGHAAPCELFELDLDDVRVGPLPLAA
ncbi:GNAT family N-acetyltransferase [uncultured Sphingomonas sp.]|uniref:GNAT family N-acetyltransferase n=1 Tax=uncultured Sphingomonas sp. TaxID=158754 RepID=UPI0035C9BC95